MARNQWGVEIVTDAEDFAKWVWDSDRRDVCIEAARLVNAELVKETMLDLCPGEADATFHALFFEGNLEFCMSLGALVADFIESREDRRSRKIEGEHRQDAERLAAHLEQAAASIRAKCGGSD